MIEILADENEISARKIYRDLNEDEKTYLIMLIAKERPAMTLQAVTNAVRDKEVMEKALKELKEKME